MDPNLFVLDYNRLTELLLVIVLFSMFLERALSVIYESRYYIEFIDWLDNVFLKILFSKEFITIIIASFLCLGTHLDAFTILLASSSKTSCLGEILTAAIIAGGSKASIKLFRDVLKIMSSAEKERQQEKKEELALKETRAADKRLAERKESRTPYEKEK